MFKKFLLLISCLVFASCIPFTSYASEIYEEQATWKLKNIEKLYEDNEQETRNLSKDQDDVIDMYSLWKPNKVSYRIQVYVRKIGKDSSSEANFDLKDSWVVENAEDTDSLITVTAPVLTGCTVINASSTSTPKDNNDKNKTSNDLSETAGKICLQISAFGDSASNQKDKMTTYRFYYTRNNHNLTLVKGIPYLNNATYSSHPTADRIDTAITSSKSSYEYGEEFNIKAIPATGYSFAKWDCTGFSDTSSSIDTDNKVNMTISWSGSGKTHTESVEMASGGSGKTAQVASGYMPATNVILVAHPQPENVNYTVNHYREEINVNTGVTTGWGSKESVTAQALADSKITSVAKYKDYTGFNKAGAKSTSNGSVTTQELTVSHDGSSVASWYYPRNNYTVTLTSGGGISSFSGNGTFKYGQKTTIRAIPDNNKDYTHGKSTTYYDNPYWTYPGGETPTSASSTRYKYKQGYFYYQTYIRDKYHWSGGTACSGADITLTVTANYSNIATGDYRYASQSTTRTNETSPTYVGSDTADWHAHTSHVHTASCPKHTHSGNTTSGGACYQTEIKEYGKHSGYWKAYAEAENNVPKSIYACRYCGVEKSVNRGGRIADAQEAWEDAYKGKTCTKNVKSTTYQLSCTLGESYTCNNSPLNSGGYWAWDP